MNQHVMRFLTELNEEGRTIVIVTHDMRVASQAKRTMTINKGGTLVTAA